MVLKYGTASDSRMTEVLSTQPESPPDVETIHSRLPSTRATGLTRLIPTAELTLEPSAEWWTSPMPFSMTIRWPTQLDSALAACGVLAGRTHDSCPNLCAHRAHLPVRTASGHQSLFLGDFHRLGLHRAL